MARWPVRAIMAQFMVEDRPDHPVEKAVVEAATKYDCISVDSPMSAFPTDRRTILSIYKLRLVDLLLCQANCTYEDRIRTDKIGQNKVLNPPRENSRWKRDRLFDEAYEAFSSESWLDTRSKPSVRHPIQQWLCGKHHLS